MNTYSKNPEKRSTQARRGWTEEETRSLVVLYLAMLQAQETGSRFVKAPAVRAMAESLGRSRGSVEAKMMNISGVLADHDRAWVLGYKPLRSYGKSMVPVILELIGGDR